MAQLASIIAFLESTLQSNRYQDASLNGVQVGGWDGPVSKVAYSVDSGLSVIESAVSEGADLLIVHHGIFWDKPLPLIGALRDKVELLMKHKCTLFASHLPLDGNPEVGNAFELGRYLDVNDLEQFLEYKGATIGAKGTVTGQSIQSITKKLSQLTGAINPLVFTFGPEKINSVGLVTGSGAFAINYAAQSKLDLLITGEPKQEAYHLAKELKMNVIFAGHYATETFGVAAITKKVAEKLSLIHI